MSNEFRVAAGGRIDRQRPIQFRFDTTEYEEMQELVREGLEVVRDAPAERQAVLLEWSAFSDFVLEQTIRMRDEWQVRRAALVAEGKLPR